MFKRNGGEGGIRTPGTRKRSTVFKTAAFNHSATSPNTTFLLLSGRKRKTIEARLRNESFYIKKII